MVEPMPIDVTRVDALLAGGEPDWAAIDFDVCCSRCGYNLRLLPQPRCPECGLVFSWRDVLLAQITRNPFLFEHHWRELPVRSFVRTVWRALRPRRFWRSVSLHERIHRGPLVVLLAVSVVMYVGLLVGTAAGGQLLLRHFRGVPTVTRGWSGSQWDWRLLNLYNILEFVASMWRHPRDLGFTIALVFPALLFGALGLLCLLRETLGRCRLRTIHMVRIVAYAAIPVALSTAGLALSGLGLLSLPTLFNAGAVTAFFCMPFVHFLPAVPLGLHLAAGLREYAGIPRPRIVAWTTAGVAALFSFTIMATAMFWH